MLRLKQPIKESNLKYPLPPLRSKNASALLQLLTAGTDRRRGGKTGDRVVMGNGRRRWSHVDLTREAGTTNATAAWDGPAWASESACNCDMS